MVDPTNPLSTNPAIFNAESWTDEPDASPHAIYGTPEARRDFLPGESGYRESLDREDAFRASLDKSAFDEVQTPDYNGEPSSLYDVVAENARDTEYTVDNPTNSLTFLTALARIDTKGDPILQMGTQAIEDSRQLLERQEERAIRNQLAVKQQEAQLVGLRRLVKNLGLSSDPQGYAAANQAYQNVLGWDLERRARIAIETEAIDRIQDMATSDPVQAKVLFDLLDKGNAEARIRDHQVKMAILAQRAEEFSRDYEDSSVGRSIFSFLMNLVPLNYNFSRSGIVDGGSIEDFLKPGSAIRNQNAELLNMPLEDFVEYTKKDGEFVQSLRNNATTIIGTSDPGMAVELMNELTTQTDYGANVTNVWGAVEVASVVPYSTIYKATRTLSRAGAAREAVRNLDNYLDVLDSAGPEAATRTTGVNEAELVDEVSISAVNPARPVNEVPLAEQLATRRAARDEALKHLEEIYNPPAMERMRTPEEIQAAFEGKIAEIEEQIGRPVKDWKPIIDVEAGGATVKAVEVVIGRKGGHGFASEASVRTATRKMGLAAEPVEVITTTERIVDPKEGFNLKVYHGTTGEVSGNLRESTSGAMGPGLYVGLKPNVANVYARNLRASGEDVGGGNVLPLLVRKEKIFGIDNIKGYTIDEAYRALDEVGIDADDFNDWKSGQNIESLADEASLRNDSKIDSDTLYNDIVRYLERRTQNSDEVDLRAGEELVQERLRTRGWEGVATKVYDHEQAVIFDAGNVINQFEPVQVFQETSGQWFARIRKDMDEVQWFQDPLHPPAQGFLSKLFGRYVRSAPRISDEELHGRALEVGSRLNRAQKVIQGQVMKTFKDLPKESREVVRGIAMLGARRERWFTPEEFSALTERQWKRPATEVEQEAYAKFRLYNDMDWEIRNATMYVNKVYEGKESTKFTTRWGQELDVDAKIDYDLSTVPTERVFDVSENVHYTRKTNRLTGEKLTQLKNDGYVMLRLEEPLADPRGMKTNLVLIKKTDVEISPLRKEQLAYSEGGHRMYVDPVFVKQGRKGVQADTGSTYLEAPGTFRTARNIAEGKAWAATMERARLALKDNRGLDETYLDDVIFKHDPAFPTGREFLDGLSDGTYNLDHPFEAVWNRELPSMYQQSGEDVSRLFDEDELGLNGYYRTTGRMYTSSKGEILRNTKGELADILDPYDMLKTSLEQATRQIGLQNYKVEAVNRFVKTYRQYLDIQPNHKFPTQILTEAKVSERVPIEMKNQIEAQRAAITNVLAFETPVDKATRQMWQSTAEWVIGDGSNFARKIAHDALWWWKERGPLQQLRGLVFDAKLGMFNPGQLLVQISTMFSATALSPKYGWKGMAGLFPMHAYLLSKGSEPVLETLSKRGVWKVMGFDSAEEFKEYARHMHMHGFPDMNGQHVMIRDFGPNSHFGSLAERGQHLREQARVFFYTAETYNRLVAYRIAWGEAKDKGLKATAPNFNETILRLADDYSMNMTGESASYWQKGLLSIPTQFWAYNVRMMDAMLGKRFTPAQRIRLALAQVAMAGSLGIPGVGALTHYLKEKNGESPSIDTVEGMLDRGLVDYINYQLTGQDILIGERIGTGGWATETVKALFGASEYGERSFMDLMGGATYSIAKKTAEGAWSTMGAVAAYATAESGADMGEKAIARDKLIALFKEVSTFSNVTKAMMIHQHGMYLSNKGTVIVSDLPAGNAVYAALSFRPSKAEEISYLMGWEENKKESLKEVATQLRNWRQEAFNNPDKYEENMQKANALVRMLPPLDRRQVIRQTNNITDASFYDHIENKVREEKLRMNLEEGLSE